MIAEHVEKNTFTEEIVIAAHDERKVTPEFRKARKIIEADGHGKCFICNTTEDLEEHHYGCEKAQENNCKFDKLKEFLLTYDVYGYSKVMKNIPLISLDDIRNQMMLCKMHHTGKGTGVHCMTFGTWIMQKVADDLPVAQKGETIEQVKERVE